MVQMNNVRKVYESSNTVALDGVSLTINDGEFVFLVGPSGSGKTTIMKLITGEVRPTSGQIIVNDFDMGTIKRRKLPKVRRTLGVIFQDYRLIENMNVYDNVAFAMRVVGAANSEIKKRVPYILELVGLEGRGKRMPNELSGGEQQRVAIARALVNSSSMRTPKPKTRMRAFFLVKPEHFCVIAYLHSAACKVSTGGNGSP